MSGGYSSLFSTFMLALLFYECCSGRRTHRRRGRVSNLSAQKNPNLLWTRATPFWKSEYCNIVGRSGLCELVCTHETVGEFASWNNPTDQSGGNAVEGRWWALEQIFERWRHQYRYFIPSHPMYTTDRIHISSTVSASLTSKVKSQKRELYI